MWIGEIMIKLHLQYDKENSTSVTANQLSPGELFLNRDNPEFGLFIMEGVRRSAFDSDILIVAELCTMKKFKIKPEYPVLIPKNLIITVDKF
jgi:hypothetical protein